MIVNLNAAYKGELVEVSNACNAESEHLAACVFF